MQGQPLVKRLVLQLVCVCVCAKELNKDRGKVTGLAEKEQKKEARLVVLIHFLITNKFKNFHSIMR